MPSRSKRLPVTIEPLTSSVVLSAFRLAVMPPHAANRFEDVVAVAQRRVHRIREHAADVAAVNVDEAIAVGDGQPLKQRGVDEAEDRGVGADAERERQDGGDGKAWLLSQHARGVAHVLPEIAERGIAGGAPGVMGGGTCAWRSGRM